MHGRGVLLLGAWCELLLRDDDLRGVIEVRDREVRDRDVCEACSVHLLAEHRRAHGARAHARVACEDDARDRLGHDRCREAREERRVFALVRLRLGNGGSEGVLTGCLGREVALARCPEDDGRDDERHRRCDDDRRHHSDEVHDARADRLRADRDDAAGSRGAAEAGAEQHVGCDARCAAADDCEQQGSAS